MIYAQYSPDNNDSQQYLAHPEKLEFRGHQQVIEQHYDGATTAAALLQEMRYWFYQGFGGLTGCLPTITNNKVNESDACYMAMRESESWKGKEFKTEVWNAGESYALQQSTHTFGRTELAFYGSDTTTELPSNHYRTGRAVARVQPRNRDPCADI